MSFIYRTIAPSLFPSICWHVDDSAVHLSFDDGPHPVATPKVLDILKARQIRATFFLDGRNVSRFPELARAIIDEGHAIGNHASAHASFAFRSYAWQADQIMTAGLIIEAATGTTPRLFRPPFGRFNTATVRAVKAKGLRMVMWDVDSKDFTDRGIEPIVRRVCAQTLGGSIILFHDNDSTSGRIQQYLNPILDFLQGHDREFSPLSL